VKSSVYDIVELPPTFDCKEYSKIKWMGEHLCAILSLGLRYEYIINMATAY
jgi:hypothetical protein